MIPIQCRVIIRDGEFRVHNTDNWHEHSMARWWSWRNPGASVMKCPFLTPTLLERNCHDYSRKDFFLLSLLLLCCPLLVTKQTAIHSHKSDTWTPLTTFFSPPVCSRCRGSPNAAGLMYRLEWHVSIRKRKWARGGEEINKRKSMKSSIDLIIGSCGWRLWIALTTCQVYLMKHLKIKSLQTSVTYITDSSISHLAGPSAHCLMK